MTVSGNGKEWRKFLLLYLVAVVALAVLVYGVTQIAAGSGVEGGKTAVDADHLKEIAIKALEIAFWSAALGVLGTAILPYIPGIGNLLTKRNGNTPERSDT